MVPIVYLTSLTSAREKKGVSVADGCKPARPNVDSGLEGRQKHSGVDADYFTSPVTKEHLYNVRGQHRASHMSVR